MSAWLYCSNMPGVRTAGEEQENGPGRVSARLGDRQACVLAGCWGQAGRTHGLTSKHNCRADPTCLMQQLQRARLCAGCRAGAAPPVWQALRRVCLPARPVLLAVNLKGFGACARAKGR